MMEDLPPEAVSFQHWNDVRRGKRSLSNNGEQVIWGQQFEFMNSKTITDANFVVHVILPLLEKQHENMRD